MLVNAKLIDHGKNSRMEKLVDQIIVAFVSLFQTP